MKTYCINLAQRKSKWYRTQLECMKLNLDPERFDAILDTNGHMGCMQSHLKLLEQIEEQVFMIIEDDIEVLDNVLAKAIKQLPDDWDMLYLGAELTKKIERYSDNLYRLKGGKVTHAIIYNNKGVVDYILENCRLTIDEFYAFDVQEKFNVYITYPMVCSQMDGYSDTQHWWTNYDVMRANYIRYT